MANDAEVLDAFSPAEPDRGRHPGSSRPPWPRWAGWRARRTAGGWTVMITLSGRGDKDMAQVREIFGRARA